MLIAFLVVPVMAVYPPRYEPPPGLAAIG